jgi:hypothetical protein
VDTDAVPVAPPLHNTGVATAVDVNAGGCVMVTVAVVEQPFTSVTVTVYGPAVNGVPVGPVPPPGDHAYEYGPVPPEAATVADPLLPPKQETFTVVVMVAVGDPAFGIVTLAVPVHPFASVYVTV